MTQEKFWNIISKLNWNIDFDYKRISTEIMKPSILPIEERKSFYSVAQNLHSNLYDHINTFSEEDYSKYVNGSDDTLDDIISHIIGVGKKTYNKCFMNKSELQKYSPEGEIGYKENFFYSFQNLSDWIYSNKQNDTKEQSNFIDTIKKLEQIKILFNELELDKNISRKFNNESFSFSNSTIDSEINKIKEYELIGFIL
mgnify:CR=1 FL=1